MQIKDEDEDSVSCMYGEESAVATPEWQNSKECAFTVEEDHIKNELVGSFLEACHFSIGDRVTFFDKNEIDNFGQRC